MEDDFVSITGQPVAREELVIQRAREFAALVGGGATPNVILHGCSRSEDGRESVVIDVWPTVPQRPAQDIKRVERVSVSFRSKDDRYPDVRALRKDFPRDRVLHLNQGIPADEQPSLCLFAESWPDARLSLTANDLVFRIQDWFDGTANGKLHRPDQPLEPAFLSIRRPVVLDPSILEKVRDGEAFQLELDMVKSEAGEVLVTRRPDRLVKASLADGYVVCLTSKPHDHSIMNVAPRTFHDLNEMVQPIGIDLIGEVQKKLFALGDGRKRFKILYLFLVLLRKREGSDKPVPELAAFLCVPEAQNPNLDDLLRDLGMDNGTFKEERTGQNSEVVYMSVRFELTPEMARNYSGASDLNPKLFAVGAGAIGSQLIANSVRSGFTSWHVLDSDHLLPHNLVRHELPGYWIGHPKATSLATDLNSLFNEPVVQGVVADILEDIPEESRAKLLDAEAIVDLSASLAVSRSLAVDLDAQAPRCSVFVSPSGRDLVFLGEDPNREFRLDSIESQYYRAIASDPALAGHLEGANVFGSCRDITSVISQEMMGLHAVQGTRALRFWLNEQTPLALVARTQNDALDISSVPIELGKPIHVGELGGWNIFTDEMLLEVLRSQRERSLPHETGGVLLAHFDVQRHNVYVCHQIPAPPDSVKQPTVYIRGSEGLSSENDRIRKATGNGLAYIGEWHSHPDGAACSPSEDDILAGAWLAQETRLTSMPGLMLIVGQCDATCWMLCQRDMEADAPVHLSLCWRAKE